MATASQNTQNPAQQNAIARATLLQTGLDFTKRLPAVALPTSPLGQTIRVPLDRSGIVTGVTIFVNCPLTISQTLTSNGIGPESLISNVQYVDFSGVKHVNTSAVLLHQLNALKGSKIFGNTFGGSGFRPAESPIDTDILSYPLATGSQNLQFVIHIPLAYSATSDLRGAVLAQTDRGEHYVTLTFCNSLVGTDPLGSPYLGGAATIAAANISLDVYQHYIMPQAGVTASTLPVIDLSTIYEISGGMIDSSNIVAGQSKYINWPNNRAIMSALHYLDQGSTGGVLNGTDVSQITLLLNGNTNLREQAPKLNRLITRSMLQTDTPSGLYYLSARSKPISTQLYGNVQSRFDIVTAAANTYFTSQFESTYLSGTPLPGVLQS